MISLPFIATVLLAWSIGGFWWATQAAAPRWMPNWVMATLAGPVYWAIEVVAWFLLGSHSDGE